MRPAGNVYTYAGSWVANTGDRHDAIDEITIDNDTTYIGEELTGKKYIWYPEDFTSGNIIDTVILYGYARMKQNGTADFAFGRAYSSEQAFIWCTSGIRDTTTLTTSYAKDSIVWTQDPCTGSAWSSTYLNSNSYGFGYESITQISTDSTTEPDSFGLNSGNSVWNYSTGWVDVQRFESTSAGTLTTLRIYSTDVDLGSNVKMAIYSDTVISSIGWPKRKLWGDETGVAITNGWTSVTTDKILIEANTYYWLASKISASCSLSYQSGGPTYSHRTRNDQPYANAWPDWTCFTAGASCWDYNNGNQIVEKAIIDKVILAPQEQRITQAFIVVKSHAEAAEGNPRRRRIITGD